MPYDKGLHDLLVERYDKKDTSRIVTTRLYEEVSSYVRYLEQKQFGSRPQGDAHRERVVAFYDFIEQYVIPRNKSFKWAITVFRRRFTAVCMTLQLKNNGINVRGAELGFADSFIKNFLIRYLQSVKTCRSATNYYECVETEYFKNRKHKGDRAKQTFRNNIQTLTSFLQVQELKV